MATKFSEFTAGATTANTFIVGFDSNLNTNNKYTKDFLKNSLFCFFCFSIVAPAFYSGLLTLLTMMIIALTLSIDSSEILKKNHDQ